ncbi:MAG: amidohydrolase family protein [Synechococcus sp. s2_metabat2_7]|nr:amidohydrolase family protein [Synechococcus sp. s2_metabat2_7]
MVKQHRTPAITEASEKEPTLHKIALEEHFSIRELLPTSEELEFFDPQVLDVIESLLPELAEKRLANMDKAGIEIAVLSQTAPGIQAISNSLDASAMARHANDALHTSIELQPRRFKGFAALNLQDIDAACAELKRCVNELGFVGALVNGSTQGEYLDNPRLDPLWLTLEQLDVPLYLHPGLPTNQPASMVKELDGATWGWSFDTATHALRLIVKGVFDKHPNAKVILGHMGENLPFYLWRLDSRYLSTRYRNDISTTPSAVFRRNFFITTSGVCDDAALQCSISTLGPERIMFSTDYPYEDIELAGRWMDQAMIDPLAKMLICRDTARTLLRLD